MNLMTRLSIRLRTLSKWALSFRKDTWELADYPVYIRELKPDPESPFNSSRFRFHPYVADIASWHLPGFGDSKQDALIALEERFAEQKASLAQEGKPLPRPGTAVPLELASQERVDAHGELAGDFIHRVLELDSAWISDDSSLWDFHVEATNEEYFAKIRDIYGVSVTDIESARLCDIFDRIASSRSNSNPIPH
jgi:hypothetical protein